MKIVPRLLFEGWGVPDFVSLFADDERMMKIATQITKTAKVRYILLVFCI